jgi:glycine oxidase
MLTARELRRSGARVTLLERGETGREASWAGGGILSPLYPWQAPDAVTALSRWSQAQFPSLAQELWEESGVDPEWTQSGLLVLHSDEDEALLWAERAQIRLEAVSYAAFEPALVARGAMGLWMPDVAQIRSPRLARAMKQSLLIRGVHIREQIEVTGLALQHQRVIGVDTTQGRLHANKVVVASGAWSGQLLRGLGVNLPIAPVRGQMILFKAPAGLVSRIIVSDGRYIIPRRDGRILVGSTVEHAGFDKTTTDAALQELRSAAMILVPAMADCEVEHQWAGLRPGSPLGIPFIGAHPDIEGLYINTGHYRNGIVMAPASARLLANIMLGASPILPPEPYAL